MGHRGRRRQIEVGDGVAHGAGLSGAGAKVRKDRSEPKRGHGVVRGRGRWGQASRSGKGYQSQRSEIEGSELRGAVRSHREPGRQVQPCKR